MHADDAAYGKFVHPDTCVCSDRLAFGFVVIGREECDFHNRRRSGGGEKIGGICEFSAQRIHGDVSRSQC